MMNGNVGLKSCVSTYRDEKKDASLTPPGTKEPMISAPPSGVLLGSPFAIGGYMRRASFRHASMYSKLLTEPRAISPSLANEERTSSVAFFKQSGCVRSRNVTPDSRVAVVSEPPMMRISAFDIK
jgi:hypothetical protein